MICPNCGKELQLNNPVLYNVDAYGKSTTARALCCKTLVRVIPVRSFKVEPYVGANTADDWGN